MPEPQPERAGASRMTPVAWTVCVIAAIGFAFDIYELLMLPLIARNALMELGGLAPGTDGFARWIGALFYVPALCGGLFGLWGGWLTDRFGRRRVLTWSILLYAFSAFFAGFSTNLWMLLFFRTTTFIGVCVEFVAAVAWLAELFDEPRLREKVLGYTQAFSSLGGLLVAVVNSVLANQAASLPAVALPGWLASSLGQVQNPHADWRYTLMSGLIPAIPLIVIRPFLPESPKWVAKRAAGTLQRPSVAALFAPDLRRTTLVTTVMYACSYGVAFGAIQQLPQIVPGIDQVKSSVARATEGLPEGKARAEAGRVSQIAVANYTKAQELGGLFGRFALALVVAYFFSRRNLLRLFLVPGLVALPLIFLAFSRGAETEFFRFNLGWLPGFHTVSVSALGLAIFFAGFFTVAQFSFWGNYLPHAYPVHLRGTGESFAANIGGRMLGTPFAYVTQSLAVMPFVPGASPAAKTAVVAAVVALALYAINLALTFWLPEPERDLASGD